MAVTVRRLFPSSPSHWQILVTAEDVAPGDAIELADDTTGERTPQTGRVVRIAVGVSDAAGGATEAIPVLATTDASPALLTSILTLDPIAAADTVDQALATPIPYAVHPDGPLYLHPGVDAGTATITAQILILGGWAQ